MDSRSVRRDDGVSGPARCQAIPQLRELAEESAGLFETDGALKLFFHLSMCDAGFFEDLADRLKALLQVKALC